MLKREGSDLIRALSLNMTVKEVMGMKYVPWVLAVLAIWLLAAPFVLGYTETAAAMQNDIAAGSALLVGAFFLAFSGWEKTAIGRGQSASH